jgi:hypothetical protein
LLHIIVDIPFSFQNRRAFRIYCRYFFAPLLRILSLLLLTRHIRHIRKLAQPLARLLSSERGFLDFAHRRRNRHAALSFADAEYTKTIATIISNCPSSPSLQARRDGLSLQRRKNHNNEHGNQKRECSRRHARLPDCVTPFALGHVIGRRERGHWLWMNVRCVWGECTIVDNDAIR